MTSARDVFFFFVIIAQASSEYSDEPVAYATVSQEPSPLAYCATQCMDVDNDWPDQNPLNTSTSACRRAQRLAAHIR